MSNVATKADIFQIRSFYARFEPISNNETQIPEAEDESAEVPSYQDVANENVLPDVPQVMQTLLPMNPNVLRI